MRKLGRLVLYLAITLICQDTSFVKAQSTNNRPNKLENKNNYYVTKNKVYRTTQFSGASCFSDIEISPGWNANGTVYLWATVKLSYSNGPGEISAGISFENSFLSVSTPPAITTVLQKAGVVELKPRGAAFGAFSNDKIIISSGRLRGTGPCIENVELELKATLIEFPEPIRMK